MAPVRRSPPPAKAIATEANPAVGTLAAENFDTQKVVAQKVAYREQTLRPIVCLAFVLPLVIIYECASVLLGDRAIHTGVDQWLNQLFGLFAYGRVAIMPVVITSILIIWHHQRKDHWNVNPLVLSGMVLESTLLGSILYLAASACYVLATVASPIVAETAVSIPPVQWLAAHVGVLGSGIYEEAFFRIILLLPMIAWATWLTGRRRLGVVSGMVFSSLIFAAVHYSIFNSAGHHFELSSFLFRFGASIVFCNLFLFRGFGIAVGAHVVHDLLTQL